MSGRHRAAEPEGSELDDYREWITERRERIARHARMIERVAYTALVGALALWGVIATVLTIRGVL